MKPFRFEAGRPFGEVAGFFSTTRVGIDLDLASGPRSDGGGREPDQATDPQVRRPIAALDHAGKPGVAHAKEVRNDAAVDQGFRKRRPRRRDIAIAIFDGQHVL
jgi:hypothetical protein